MTKRVTDPEESESPYLKRQRFTTSESTKQKSVESEEEHQIRSVQDLKILLAFVQDVDPQSLRQNIKTFKKFLDSIIYGDDDEGRSAKRRILLQYLQSSEDKLGSQSISSIIQFWGFANQSNNEGLFAAIAAVLALYLKVTSTHVEFREYGNNLCEALLREDQIKLFSRGLNTNKPKEHVISPCLRLLTEIVSYDGGTAAGALYAHSDTFLKRLDTFLAMRHEYELDSVEGRQRPSVRYNALRFVCANLKLQGPNAKNTILGQGNIIRAVFQYIKSDSPSVVSELLNNLEQDVLLDKAISRTSKNRVFNERNLGRIATLYQFHESHDTSESRTINVQDVAHSFLLRLCTTVERGILIRTAEGTPQGRPNFGDEGDKLDFRIPLAAQESQRPQLVKNTTLASFLQGLRPYANVLQTELVIKTFQAAPELLADYFLQKKSFSFEPKLTATWVGFSMFIISTIQLPIQRKWFHMYDQRHDVVTPNLHWILESILPRPLNQKVLMRCLNQNISLITFITVRILVAAFQKLEATLEFLVGPDRSELFIQFSKRCPEIRHVIAVFHRYSSESLLMREAITRLLALYYKVFPQFALEEKFDISIIISHELRDKGSEAKCIRGIDLSDLSLQNLLEIAERSPNMRWWHKPGYIEFSPFTTLLRLCVMDQIPSLNDRISALLKSAIEDSPLFKANIDIPPFDALCLSLQHTSDWRASDSLFEFLDNCLQRLVKRPVKYYEDCTELTSSIRHDHAEVENHRIDLLLITILEQWPFLTGSDAISVENIARWLARYLDLLMQAGGCVIVLSNIRDRIMSHDDKMLQWIFKNVLKESSKYGMHSELKNLIKSSLRTSDHEVVVHSPTSCPTLDEVLVSTRPPIEGKDHLALRSIRRKAVVDAIIDGDVGELVQYLCSEHEDIRIQALANLQSFLIKLKDSGYAEWQQIYVLIGEVIEVAQDITSKKALPYFAGAVAVRALLILVDPLHFMYSKINKFLNKAPRWDLAKMPSYWVDKVFLNPPTEDNAYYQEVEWLLEALIDGLRTSNDMEMYRRCHILERILTISTTFLMPMVCFEKIVSLLYRCTFVKGSSTLITRCGLLSWISTRLKAGKGTVRGNDVLKLLASRAYDTSDKEWVDDWSNGGVLELLRSFKDGITV